MKIAITSTSDVPGCQVDSRFGRAPWIMIFDSQSDSWEPVSNDEAAKAGHGAGVSLAEIIARKGVDAVITGSCGPKAMQALGAAGIPVFLGDARPVHEALRCYNEGTLKQMTEPNAPGR